MSPSASALSELAALQAWELVTVLHTYVSNGILTLRSQSNQIIIVAIVTNKQSS